MGTLVVPGIAALKQYIGSEVGVTDYLEVGQERIAGFAEITDDRQWIHTDVERARSPSKSSDMSSRSA